MVDVGFHHEFVAQFFPGFKIEGVQVGLAFGSLCRNRDVGVIVADWPIRTRS